MPESIYKVFSHLIPPARLHESDEVLDVNSVDETEIAISVAEKVTGKKTINAEKIMGAEDFSYMLNSAKGAYILIGNGDTPSVHSPTYIFNDEIIPIGSSYWAELVETKMQL